jgi:hypothetical protein
MERLHAYVGSTKPALQETPEVLWAVGVDLPVNVHLRVIDDIVLVVSLQAEIGLQLVGVNVGTFATFSSTFGSKLPMVLSSMTAARILSPRSSIP